MALTRVLFAVFVIMGMWAAGAAGQDNCEPSCPSDCTPGYKVPNPVNCRQYYECLEDCVPSDPVFDCEDGYKFDVATAACQPGSGNVTCGTCTPPCKFTCTAGYAGLVADRDNCQVAYLCQFDPPLTTNCGTNMYFDGTKCQSDQTQCCDACQVYCEAAFIEILDPYDCTAYYYCTEVGWPLAEDRYLCGDDEIFVDGHCKVKAITDICYQPCAGTVS